MSTKNILLSIAVGAAVGAALGVLFAPAKGTVTRRRIARSGTDIAEDVKEKLNGYIDAVADEYDSIKDSAVELAELGKRKAVSMAAAVRVK